MKITKSKLKQLIKEEISKILSEDESQVVEQIPEGATVIPNRDSGIAWFLGDSYEEIMLYDITPEILKQIGSRTDLKFKIFKESMAGDEFVKRIPDYWYDTKKSTQERGYMSNDLPDWVYKTVGKPNIND